jgi:RNA polymerase subunit RPABC4/transcription elongation factor Spt4
LTEEQAEVCPSCGKRMDEGYVAAGSVIAWSKKKVSNWALRPFRDSKVLESTPIRAIINVEAYHCPKCKLILIKYGQTRKPDGTPKSFLKKCTNCDKEIPIASETCPYCGTKQP